MREVLATALAIVVGTQIGCSGEDDGPVCAPSAEVCDGLDNDCDGQADEGCDCTPSAELCDGVDNDCNGQADEGCVCTDGATQACFTGPATARGVGRCRDGSQTCAGGQWGSACPGEVVPGTEVCDGAGVDEDCDGVVDEPYVPDLDPACAETLRHLGEVSGDTDERWSMGAAGAEERWFSATFREDHRALFDSTPVTGIIRLRSPVGADFDLHVYCGACGTAASSSSTLRGVDGHEDIVRIRKDETAGNDTFTVLVEVRYVSGSCAEWRLGVGGFVAVENATCP